MAKKKTKLLYDLPQLFDAGGDIKKPWYVYYRFESEGGKKERFRIKGLDGIGDINRKKTKEERKYVAGLIISAITELLESGYNPFIESKKQTLKVETDALTIEEGSKQFLQYKASVMRKITNHTYAYVIRSFVGYMKERHPDVLLVDVKVTQVQGFFDHRKLVDNIKNATYNTERTVISMFFNFFVERIDGFRSPFKVKRLKDERVSAHKVYTIEERDKLFNYLKVYDIVLLRYLLFIYYVCLRPNEIRYIRVQDIDLVNNRLNLKSEQVKNKKSSSIIITPGLASVIKSMELEKYPGHYFLFGRTGVIGEIMVGRIHFMLRFRKVMNKLGFPPEYTMYGLKHTRNIEIYMQYKDVHMNMRLNRHNDISSTMKYLRELGFFMEDKIENETIYL